MGLLQDQNERLF